MRIILAVRPDSLNYLSYYDVHVAADYEEARSKIQYAESIGEPFDELDLNVSSENEFLAFLDWMDARGSKYPFSIFGYASNMLFMKVRDISRSRGFHFNS